MTTNHNGVTRDHAERASAFLAAAQEARHVLDAEYAKPRLCHDCQVPGAPIIKCEHTASPAKIGDLNARIWFAFNAAKIESQLAVADAVLAGPAFPPLASRSAPYGNLNPLRA